MTVIALIVISYATVILAHRPGPGLFTLVFWQYAYARRLHDIDRTAWWGVVVIVLSFVPIVLGFAFAGDELGALLLDRTDQASNTGWFWYFAAQYGSILIQHGFTIWLGLQRGDPVDNRFGDWPRPPRWLSQSKRG
jgi:uncharacterized membrane protein YhaH (DUF805 family)